MPTKLSSPASASLYTWHIANSSTCPFKVELWNEGNGTLQKSNQYLLTQALQKAGGAIGYLIVLEIDNNSSEYDSLNPSVKFETIKGYLKYH